MKIAISTGGGDAPGLNAVIRAAVLGGLLLLWWGYARRHFPRPPAEALAAREGTAPSKPSDRSA